MWWARQTVTPGYQENTGTAGSFQCETPEMASSWAHQEGFLKAPKIQPCIESHSTLVEFPRRAGNIRMVPGLILLHAPSEPSYPAISLCPHLGLATALQSTGLSTLRSNSSLSWDHLSPSWYSVLSHRAEGASLSQRVLDRSRKVELEPQPIVLDLLEGKSPCQTQRFAP